MSNTTPTKPPAAHIPLPPPDAANQSPALAAMMAQATMPHQYAAVMAMAQSGVDAHCAGFAKRIAK